MTVISMIGELLFLLCYFTIQQNRQEVHIRSLEREVGLSVDSHLANVPNIYWVMHSSTQHLQDSW